MRLPARVVLPARATALVLALAPVLVACGQDSGPSDGDVIAARADDQFVDGTTGRLRLPHGQLEVSLGEATNTLEANETRQLESLSAPSGHTFLPITWRYDTDIYGDFARYLDADGTAVYELVADGATYRLPPPDPSGVDSESFYVVVAGEAADPVLSVAFDGVTQTLDLSTGERDAGQAAPLYDLRSRNTSTRSCARDVSYATEPIQPPGFDCTRTPAARLPYASGEWAAEGRSWLVLSMTTSLLRWDRVARDGQSGAIYVASDVESDFLLGKITPTRVVESKQGTSCPDPTRGCVQTYDLIFDVPAGDAGTPPRGLTVAQDYGFDLFQVWGGGRGKESITESLTIKTMLNEY